MTLAFACFFFGSWLGMRVKVAVLVPTTFVVIAIIWFVGQLAGQETSSVVLTQIGSVVALQVGYLSAAWFATRSAQSRLRANSLAARDYH